MKKILFATFVCMLASSSAAQFKLTNDSQATICCDAQEQIVVHTAIGMVQRDYRAVFSDTLIRTSNPHASILVRTDASSFNGKSQAFKLSVTKDHQLSIIGSDAHGTAYGLMELSRLMGVSPWEWWADATPKKKKTLELPQDYVNEQSPSVEFRGIFINDEDWGLMPWSSKRYEPKLGKGMIGPRTNARIFELMLRLRANYYWPAMHECTVPFFLTKGNREVAQKYGIYVGGSHCEPMATSTPGEWKRRGKGEYDYVKNAPFIREFWSKRLQELAGQPILYTLGMRGVHDGKMQGVKGMEEQKRVLQQVIEDQRDLLRRYINPDVTKIPQVFIPYKEVLEVYNAGLEVPDDVTLMWCDDNYGYIRHFPTEKERMRKGGNGIYYHVSYWGRPHDHLWLCTFHPALVYQQMMEAYERGIQRMWILNVGDIKPYEYQTELFMDMAWNIDLVKQQGVKGHLQQFLQREFGDDLGSALTPVMLEHYRLSYILKPEFLGNTRTEEAITSSWTTIKDLPWSQDYIEQRLSEYQALSAEVEKLSDKVVSNRQDEYFQLIKYPVQAAYQMNEKMLKAQLARHGRASWRETDVAYDSIVSLTRIYNTGIHNQSKWHLMMDHQPRRLPVFEPVPQKADTTPLCLDRKPFKRWNGADASKGAITACELLGYEGKAALLNKDKSVIYAFTDENKSLKDSIEVELRMLPNHPIIDGGSLRISVSLDGKKPMILSYETKGRSEEWKQNVLRNQAIRRIVLPINKKTKYQIELKALDEGVVLDQMMVYPTSKQGF